MGKTHIAYLLTGSNLGDRFDLLNQAHQHVSKRAGEVVATSGFYETKAWGKEDQPDFLNQALQIKTELPPTELLDILKSIEKDLGRIKNEKWDSRTIDIDILFYEDSIIQLPNLTIPHALLHERNFTLIPLMEIAGEFEHPVLKKSIETLYWESKDPLEVYLVETI